MSRKTIQRRCAADSPGLQHLHPILRRVFAARGVADQRELTYQLGQLHPPQMKGLEAAVDLLITARRECERILIVGDFDADGATSTALAVRCLRAMGFGDVQFLVPNRFDYGYGLTPEIVEVAAGMAPQLIITVDNGIASVDGVAKAQALGMKVLVTDHHLPGKTLPAADAIVNPNQPGCPFLSKSAAGVGVVFYVMLALRARLRTEGFFGQGAEPNLAVYLDLVALGTVADVVPLDYNNRILVAQGLKRMRAGECCAAIAALMQVAGRELQNLSAADLGFIVGPRLNAAGRLDDMSLGIRCLLADDPNEALALAAELDGLNRERRAIELSMQKEADVALQAMQAWDDGELPAGLCLFDASWHQGVIGILASRIKDKHHRPTIVLAEDNEGQLKGSARSITGVHMRDLLDGIATANPGLLNKFGGHAMAAGLSLARAELDRFTSLFAEAVQACLGERAPGPVIETDGALQADDFNLTLAAEIQTQGPWGQAFPEPVFDGEFMLVQQRLVGQKHLKLTVAPLGSANALVDAIAFNVDLDLWPAPSCRVVRLAYKLAVNEFRGQRNCQLLVDYLEPVTA